VKVSPIVKGAKAHHVGPKAFKAILWAPYVAGGVLALTLFLGVGWAIETVRFAAVGKEICRMPLLDLPNYNCPEEGCPTDGSWSAISRMEAQAETRNRVMTRTCIKAL
jgi:hypothetical protein